MKEKDSHIELIKRYFTGDASRIDQRSLEELVKENEYALEAKEGIDKMSKVNRKTSYANLEQRLAKRVNKSDVSLSLPWMKLAAGLAILVAGAFFVLRSFGDSSNTTADNLDLNVGKSEPSRKTTRTKPVVSNNATEETSTFTIDDVQEGNPFEKNGTSPVIDGIAVKPTELSKTESVEVTNVSDFVVTTPPDITLSTTKIGDKDDTAATKNIPQSTKPEAVSSPAPTSINEEAEIVAMDTAETEIKNNNDYIVAETKQEITDSPQASGFSDLASAATGSTKAKKKVTSRSIKGKVLDDNGDPLIGAVVSDGTISNGTNTNLDGTFELSISSNIQEITVSYTGYDTKSQKILSTDNYEIYLDEHVPLSEVADIGFDQSNGFSNSASPVNGLIAFKTYIKENLKYPAPAKAKNIKGKVVLLFNLTPSGRPRDIEVKKSLGYGCDEEAIRLLVHGADWKPGTQTGKNRIVIKFR